MGEVAGERRDLEGGCYLGLSPTFWESFDDTNDGVENAEQRSTHGPFTQPLQEASSLAFVPFYHIANRLEQFGLLSLTHLEDVKDGRYWTPQEPMSANISRLLEALGCVLVTPPGLTRTGNSPLENPWCDVSRETHVDGSYMTRVRHPVADMLKIAFYDVADKSNSYVADLEWRTLHPGSPRLFRDAC